MEIKIPEIEYKVEYRQGSKWNENPLYKYKYMECKCCGQMSPASETAYAITCNDCVNESLPDIELTRRVKSDKPRGWQWMAEYVHTDGSVYHKGLEQPDLKGSLEPTQIVDKLKLTKFQKVEATTAAGREIQKLKKQLSASTSKRNSKKIKAEINRQSKILQGRFSQKFIKDFLDSK
jgi:hypothetical protein